MMKKLILFIGLLFCSATARAAETCGAGQYLKGDTCTACPSGTYKDTSGPQECTPCPLIDETTLRTTFPDSYYPYDPVTDTYVKTTTEPQFISCGLTTWVTGITAKSACNIDCLYSNVAGIFRVEQVYYNLNTNKYDKNDGNVGYKQANPGYYLDTRFRDTYCDNVSDPYYMQPYRKAIICPAGYYCPGGSVPYCIDGPYETEWGRTVCPAGSYCPAGAVAPTPCPVGTYSDTTGAIVCNPCTNAPKNAHYTAGAPANDCPWECDEGYGLHNGVCVPLCTAGMQHLKTGNGLQFNLYPVRYSTPALHVKRNDTVCYGVLAPGTAKNSININHNGQIYHMVD